MTLTTRDIIKKYKLERNVQEGGYFAPVYTSPHSLPPNYGTVHPNQQLPLTGSIYYLITSDDFSALHRVTSDMLYHFYAGDPVRVLLLDPSNGKQSHREVEFGNDLSKHQPALVIPAGTWMGSKVKGSGSHALMGVSMAPGFDPANYEIGSRAVLSVQFPKLTGLIAEYTRG